MSRTYRPQRASKRWTEDAPEYVLSCHYAPGYHDCYTVFLGGTMWNPAMGRQVVYLGLSADGASYWGEIESALRNNAGKKVRWNDLPEAVRYAVINRVKNAG